MSELKPEPGDWVRVVLEGWYRAHDERAEYHVINGDDGLNHTAPLTATVEVLKRGDDPEIGLIRRTASGKTAVKVGASLSDQPGERSLWVVAFTEVVS
jgi:hypothetical protein